MPLRAYYYRIAGILVPIGFTALAWQVGNTLEQTDLAQYGNSPLPPSVYTSTFVLVLSIVGVALGLIFYRFRLPPQFESHRAWSARRHIAVAVASLAFVTCGIFGIIMFGTVGFSQYLQVPHVIAWRWHDLAWWDVVFVWSALLYVMSQAYAHDLYLHEHKRPFLDSPYDVYALSFEDKSELKQILDDSLRGDQRRTARAAAINAEATKLLEADGATDTH